MKYWGEDEWKTIAVNRVCAWPIAEDEIVVMIEFEWDKSISIHVRKDKNPGLFTYFERLLSE